MRVGSGQGSSCAYWRPRFQVRALFYLYTEWLMNVSQKEQRRSSIIRQSPREQPTRMRTLNHDHEEQPSPAFGEPTSPSIAITTAIAAPAPQQRPTKPKPKKMTNSSPQSLEAGARMRPISYAIFKDKEPTHLPCESLRGMRLRAMCQRYLLTSEPSSNVFRMLLQHKQALRNQPTISKNESAQVI